MLSQFESNGSDLGHKVVVIVNSKEQCDYKGIKILREKEVPALKPYFSVLYISKPAKAEDIKLLIENANTIIITYPLIDHGNYDFQLAKELFKTRKAGQNIGLWCVGSVQPECNEEQTKKFADDANEFIKQIQPVPPEKNDILIGTSILEDAVTEIEFLLSKLFYELARNYAEKTNILASLYEICKKESSNRVIFSPPYGISEMHKVLQNATANKGVNQLCLDIANIACSQLDKSKSAEDKLTSTKDATQFFYKIAQQISKDNTEVLEPIIKILYVIEKLGNIKQAISNKSVYITEAIEALERAKNLGPNQAGTNKPADSKSSLNNKLLFKKQVKGPKITIELISMTK